MNIDLNKNYPDHPTAEILYVWGDTNAVSIDKVVSDDYIDYGFNVADKTYPMLINTLFDIEHSIFSEKCHKFFIKEFDEEDLNSLAKFMDVTVDSDNEQTAKNIVSEIERVGELVLKQKPVSALSSWEVKTKEGLVFKYNML